MQALKNLTVMQWIGIILGINGLLGSSTPQLTVLFGAAAIPYIQAVAALGSGVLGVVIAVIGGAGTQLSNVVANPQAQGALVRAVLAMPGVEKVSVNGQASPALATIAVDPSIDKIAPTVAAQDKVQATAAKAAA